MQGWTDVSVTAQPHCSTPYHALQILWFYPIQRSISLHSFIITIVCCLSVYLLLQSDASATVLTYIGVKWVEEDIHPVVGCKRPPNPARPVYSQVKTIAQNAEHISHLYLPHTLAPSLSPSSLSRSIPLSLQFSPPLSLMFYLISHNKASLWTAINCVWIFPPRRRSRELSERPPVPQAACPASYWCRTLLPSSLLDQSVTSLLFYGKGHFTEEQSKNMTTGVTAGCWKR